MGKCAETSETDGSLRSKLNTAPHTFTVVRTKGTGGIAPGVYLKKNEPVDLQHNHTSGNFRIKVPKTPSKYYVTVSALHAACQAIDAERRRQRDILVKIMPQQKLWKYSPVID